MIFFIPKEVNVNQRKKSAFAGRVLIGILIAAAPFVGLIRHSPVYSQTDATPNSIPLLRTPTVPTFAEPDLDVIEPLSIDLDKIVEQAASLLEDRLKALEEENAALRAEITELSERLDALEALARFPTVTPVPEGTQQPTLTPTRTPNPSGYDCETTLLSPYYYGEFSRGAEFNFTIRIRNTGSKEWGNEVMMEWVSGLKAEKTPIYAYALPQGTVAIDDEIEYSIVMVAPDEVGGDGKFTSAYALKNDQETFCEFEYNIFVP